MAALNRITGSAAGSFHRIPLPRNRSTTRCLHAPTMAPLQIGWPRLRSVGQRIRSSCRWKYANCTRPSERHHPVIPAEVALGVLLLHRAGIHSQGPCASPQVLPDDPAGWSTWRAARELLAASVAPDPRVKPKDDDDLGAGRFKPSVRARRRRRTVNTLNVKNPFGPLALKRNPPARDPGLRAARAGQRPNLITA